jgi:hypothetical protein
MQLQSAATFMYAATKTTTAPSLALLQNRLRTERIISCADIGTTSVTYGAILKTSLNIDHMAINAGIRWIKCHL